MPCFHKWLSCGQGESQPICKGTWGHLTLHRRLAAPSSYPSLACLQLQSQSFHCFPSLFFSPEKNLTCPPSHIPTCLPTAPHCPKGTASSALTGCVWFPCSPCFVLLLLWEAPSASRWFCLLQPNGVCRPSTPHCKRLSPIQWHFSCQPKKTEGTHKAQSSDCMWVSFQQSHRSSRKSQLRLEDQSQTTYLTNPESPTPNMLPFLLKSIANTLWMYIWVYQISVSTVNLMERQDPCCSHFFLHVIQQNKHLLQTPSVITEYTLSHTNKSK